MIQIKAHDDVVENVDFEKLACSDEVTGDFDVGLGWCRFAAYAACGIMLSGVSALVRSKRVAEQRDVARTNADTLPLN